MLTSNIEHVQTMTQEMPTFESAGNLTPFSEANEEKDIKNLGIKTTISITHNHISQEIT